MKNLTKKISLFLIICTLIVPTSLVNAEDPDNVGGSAVTSGEGNGGSTTTSGEGESTTTEKSNDASLAELRIEGIDLDSKFTASDLEYTAVVKSDVSSVDIVASLPENSKATFDKSQTGIKNLNVGENNFSIKVTAEAGNTVTYKLVITRATNDLNLSKLNIQGQKLNEVFDSETTNYTADITYNVTSITVQNGHPTGTTVTVSGNSNLKVGKNTVTVTVKNVAGESKAYTIIVTRGTEEDLNSTEEDDKDNTTSEDDNQTSEEEDSKTSSDVVVPSTKKDDDGNSNTLRSVIIITSSVLLLLVAGLGIYFYARSGNNEKKKQKKIDKLKKKQAKIEEQLTGLMPVITEEQEKEYLKKTVEKEPVEEEVIEEEPVEEFEETIEIEPIVEEPIKRRRTDKVVFEDTDFDELFDDDRDE